MSTNDEDIALRFLLGRLKWHEADLFVLAGYKENHTNKQLKNWLKERGYFYQSDTLVSNKDDGLLLAAKQPYQLTKRKFAHHSRRWMEIYLPESNYYLLHVDIPRRGERDLYWEEVLRYAEEKKKGKMILFGNLQAGVEGDYERMPLRSPHELEKLRTQLVDVWRFHHGDKSEYTWYGYGNKGFRIHHVFATEEGLEGVERCHYLQAERELGIADGAGIIMELKKT